MFALAYQVRHFSFVFWENWRHQKVLSKLIDLQQFIRNNLYTILTSLSSVLPLFLNPQTIEFIWCCWPSQISCVIISQKLYNFRLLCLLPFVVTNRLHLIHSNPPNICVLSTQMPNFNNYSKYNHVFGLIHNKCNIYKKILKRDYFIFVRICKEKTFIKKHKNLKCVTVL